MQAVSIALGLLKATPAKLTVARQQYTLIVRKAFHTTDRQTPTPMDRQLDLHTHRQLWTDS